VFVVAAVVGLGVARAVAILPGRARTTASAVIMVVLGAVAVECFIVSFAPTYASGEARQRPDEIEAARLFCRNEYTQRIRGTGARLNGVTLWGRRVGSGSFDLEMLIRREPDGEVLRRSSLGSAGLGSEIAEVRIPVEPFQLAIGETYFVTLRAPAATPIAKPTVLYSLRDDAGETVMINGSPGRGHLLLRENYE
jgi:hypothetical protein